MQVAVARHVDVPRVLALEQLALAPAPERRVGEHADLVRRARCRQLGERAREQQVAGRRRDRAARGGDDGRPAAPQRRGVEHVVVDERGRVDQLDRDRGAQRRRRGRLGLSPAARNTSSGRSRLPPARIVAPACSASSSPCDVASASSRASSRVHQRRDVRAAGLDEREDLLGAAHGTVPTWSAMMPPAVRIQRTSVSPAPAIRAASASGPGKRFTELGR